MIVLGIEGSANKIGIGIIKDNEILANERFTHITPPGTGFVPTETAAHHRKKILKLLEISLQKANIKLTDIDLFTYTRGPGIAPCLMMCAIVCRTLSLKYKKPIIAVNHCIGHIEMGRFITGAKNPVILYVSGGNTQVIAYSQGYYRIFGETLDVAIGNCIDRVARLLMLPNDPCPGYNVEKMAKEGRKFFKLPVAVRGMDLSFSGVAPTIGVMIKENKILLDEKKKSVEKSTQKLMAKNGKFITGEITNIALNVQENSIPVEITAKSGETENKEANTSQKNQKEKFLNDNNSVETIKIDGLKSSNYKKIRENDDNLYTVADVCYSLQECTFSALIEVTERALSFTKSNEVLITGGVGCNKKLQEMMEIMVKERNGIIHATDEKFCIDNGLMIAHTGKVMYESGTRHEIEDSDVTQRFRTDTVQATWRD